MSTAPVSEQQFGMISKIESALQVKFSGDTMVEAARFIMKHYDAWKAYEAQNETSQ